jgi:Creatinase/Prolidase N-terminal domain
MRVLETTLLTGPYDWDERMLPRGEYEGRLERVRAAMAQAGAAALAIHGHPGNYGALAYVTGFTPKLGATLALVPREGPLRILAPGTPKMMDIAKRLTWVGDVRPLGNAPKTVAEFLGDGNALGTWAFGALPQALYAGIAASVVPRTLLPLDRELDALRRRKSAREIELMRGAAQLLATATDAFAASLRAGSGVRSAALAAERAAIAAGAQDARAMASLSPGGVPLPLDAASDERALDPANAGIAVQHHGYWASGTVTVARRPGAARARAREALAAALAAARGGVHLPDGFAANAIGLSLEEGPGGLLEAGAVYAVTGSATEGGETAYASALVAVTENGCDALWQEPA